MTAVARPGRSAEWGTVFLLMGLVVVATGRSLGNGFAFDDVPILVENPQVQRLDPPWVYAQQSYWPPDNLGDAYRPWTVWWLAIQWALGGGAPVLFHLGNLLLTAGLTLAVWRLAARLLPPVGAVVAAAFFAIHPVHVEATANVVGQAELWMAWFATLAVICYLDGRGRGALSGRRQAGLASLLVLAAASKEQGIVIPGLLVAAEWLVRPGPTEETRTERRARAGRAIAILALVDAAFLVGRFVVLGDLGGGPPAAGLEGKGLVGRLSVMLPLVGDWVRLLVWPARLLAQYSPPAFGGQAGWSVAGAVGAALAIGLGLAALGARRRWPVLSLGIAWVAICLFPIGNVLFPTGILIAERTLLLPSVGAALVGGLLAAIGWNRVSRPVVGGAVVAVVGLGAARSFARQPVWRDNLTLFAQTIVDEPRSYRGFFVYGRELTRRNRPEEAAARYARAAALYGGDHRVFEEWGQILRTEGRCAEAVPIFERGVAADPEATVVRSRLFECLIALGRYDQAIAVAREGIARGGTEFEQSVTRAERARSGGPRPRSPPPATNRD